MTDSVEDDYMKTFQEYFLLYIGHQQNKTRMKLDTEEICNLIAILMEDNITIIS